jgi:DNA recombination protein RmuC
MNALIYILIALVLGILLYIIFKLNSLKSNKTTENTLENLSFKMEFEKQIALLEQKSIQLAKEKEQLETSVKTSTDELTDVRQKLTLAEKSFEYIEIELNKITLERNQLLSNKQILENEVNDFKYSIVSLQNDLSSTKYLLEQERVNLSKMQEKFTTDFEIIASKILEQKTEKFTNQNKIQLQELLQPLGENINSFKQKVDEVYTIEAKERFSLGEKVKECNSNSAAEYVRVREEVKGKGGGETRVKINTLKYIILMKLKWKSSKPLRKLI